MSMDIHITLGSYSRLFKRLIVPGGMMIIVLVVFLPLLFYTRTRLKNDTGTAQNLQAETLDLTREIRNLRANSEIFKQKIPDYMAIKTQGILTPLSRLTATQAIKSLSVKYAINKMSYEFGMEEKIRMNALEDTRVMLSTVPLTLNIEALTDEDVFTFIDALRKQGEGFITIRSLTLNRIGNDISEAIRSIMRGQRPTIIEARAVLDWSTIAAYPAANEGTPREPGTGGAP